jgi:hypothetical protein
MGGEHFRTAHRRTKPANSGTPAATALPSHLHAKRSAYARLFQGFSGMNRLRKRPAYAGALRLLDVGETKGSIFPPEPPLLLHCADASTVPTTKAMGSLTRKICPAARKHQIAAHPCQSLK